MITAEILTKNVSSALQWMFKKLWLQGQNFAKLEKFATNNPNGITYESSPHPTGSL